jgi:hypothetical protein
MRIEAGAADGTAQGKTKRIHNVTLRFKDTVGGKFGPYGGQLDEIPWHDAGDAMDTAPALFTGDKGPLRYPHGYDTDGRIEYRNDKPFPVTLVAILPQLETQDRG